MRVEEVPDRRVALGHPGAFVKQVGDAVEAGERQFHHLAAERLERGEGRVVGRLHHGVAVELPVGLGRHADP